MRSWLLKVPSFLLINALSIAVYSIDSKSDRLRPHCASTDEIWESGGLYFVTADLVNLEKKKLTPATFLLDTGWNDVSLTQTGCKKVGCKILDPKSRRTTGGAVAFGKEVFSIEE